MSLTRINGSNIQPGSEINVSSVKSDIFFFNNTTVTSNVEIAANTNAMSAGPITIANGVTVTVGANSEWTIV